MNTLLHTIAAFVSFVFGMHAFGGTIVNVSLNCTSAYTLDVYDTPDGKLGPGFYDARYQSSMGSSGPLISAKVIATNAFEQCFDGKTQYDYTLTKANLDSFNLSAAPLPAKILSTSSIQ